MTSQIEIAQLPTLETVKSSTRVLVQDGVAGTPYRQATVGNLIAGLVDDISTGTIIAGSVVITSGTATLGVLSATTATLGTVAINGGTASLSSLAVSGAMSSGTVTATIGAFTTLNTGTLAATGGTAALSSATISSLIVSGATVSSTDTRWGMLESIVTDKNGYPLAFRDPLSGRHHEGAVSIGDAIITTGTIADASVTNGEITTATAGTLINGGATIAAGDSRWGVFGSVVTDDDGYPIAANGTDGKVWLEAANVGTLTLGGDPTTSLMAATKAYVDANSGGLPTAYSDTQLIALDAVATAKSLAIREQINDSIAAPIWKYSHIIHYGQSFALGYGASIISTDTPTLTGLFSFGSRPANTVDTDVFTQSGSATFQIITTSAGSEVPALGMAYHLRRSQLQAYNLESDATRQIVVNAAGKGGQLISALSKGASPTEHYAQVMDLVAKSITAAGSDTYGVAAICYLQGESDAAGGTSGAAYLASMQTLFDDYRADLLAATAKLYKPGIFLVQTSGRWDYTLQDNSVSNAQVEIAKADPGVFMVGPYYAYSDNGTHLDADGYRNLGLMLAKVGANVMVQRKGWLPCHLRTATFRGARIWLDIHTPYPPLQVKQVYEQTTLISVSNHGFFVEDDGGSVTISSVTVYTSGVMIECDRDLVAADNPIVGYANYGTTGNGNICDSDPAISYHVSTLTGEPYPLNNWLCSFRTAIDEDV